MVEPTIDDHIDRGLDQNDFVSFAVVLDFADFAVSSVFAVSAVFAFLSGLVDATVVAGLVLFSAMMPAVNDIHESGRDSAAQGQIKA